MGKNPAFQFYTGDWSKDVELHMMSFQSRGIWIEMLICMWDAKERGKLTGTPEQLCRLIGCTMAEIETAIQELSVTKTADVTVCNDFVTIINRRMHREEKERKLTRSRVKKHREEKEKRICNADVTPPSSSSSSSSKNIPPISPKRGTSKRRLRGVTLSPDQEEKFNRFYSAYPKKVAKQDAIRAWMNICPENGLYEKIITALETHKRSRDWARNDGQYIPNPATWLNGKRWDDDTIDSPRQPTW